MFKQLSALFWHRGFRRYFSNTGWLIGEKVYRLGISLLVGILIARHLGPKDFGILSYAVSIVDFLGTFVYLGLSGLVVRELVQRSEQADEILGTTFMLKSAGSIIGFLAMLGVAFWTSQPGGVEFWVLVIMGLSLLARPLFQTLDFWFQAHVQSKYTAIATILAFSLTAIVKVVLIIHGASVIPITAILSVDFAVMTLILVLIYRRRGIPIFCWKPHLLEALNLLRRSWILILALLLGLINLKTDQVMLRWMVGPEEVGIYSVAVRFSEVWYFIPIAIMMSVFPKLLKLKIENNQIYNIRQQQLLDGFFLISLLLAILTSLLANPVIPLLFGPAYSKSASILIIHIWAGIFMFMRALFSKWMLVEDVLVFGLMSHALGALANVLLNIFLIPRAQGHGAAVATLVSYAVSSYLFLFVSGTTRPLAFKMSKSLILPVRLILYGRKLWSN